MGEGMTTESLLDALAAELNVNAIQPDDITYERLVIASNARGKGKCSDKMAIAFLKLKAEEGVLIKVPDGVINEKGRRVVAFRKAL